MNRVDSGGFPPYTALPPSSVEIAKHLLYCSTVTMTLIRLQGNAGDLPCPEASRAL